jgi:hypothetical protein
MTTTREGWWPQHRTRRDRRALQQASDEAAYGPLQEAPRGGLPKSRLPHQAQAQGLRYDEEFHDLGVTHPGHKTQ